MCDSGEVSPSEVAKPATDAGVIVPGAWWIITVFAPESWDAIAALCAEGPAPMTMTSHDSIALMRPQLGPMNEHDAPNYRIILRVIIE